MIDFSVYMQQCVALAQTTPPEDVPIAAMVLQPGSNGEYQIIGQGVNQREALNDPSAHAEVTAIKQACKYLSNWRLKGCVLLVTLEPCPMCASVIIQSRIETVVFGAYSPLEGALGSNLNLPQQLNSNLTVLGGVLEAECQALLKTCFKQKRL